MNKSWLFTSLLECTGNARNIAKKPTVEMNLWAAHITALEPRKQVVLFSSPLRVGAGVQHHEVHGIADAMVVHHSQDLRQRTICRFNEA